MSEIIPLAAMGGFSLSAQLFKNIETFPGQLIVTPPRLSAKQEVKISRNDAVRAARQVERTSEHVRGGLDRKTDMVVGAMLRVHPQPDWEMLGISDWKTKKPFAQAMARVFENWAYDYRALADGEGHHDFGGMMWQAFRGLTGPDAECAGVIQFDPARRQQYNTRWGTFVNLVDPDRIETPPQFATDPNVFMGRRLDPHGRMIGLYIRKHHPSESTPDGNMAWEYVPRETSWGRTMAFQYFFKARAQQQRGMTKLLTVLRKSTMLDQFDDAYLGSALLSQVLSTWIESMASAETVADQLAPAKDSISPWDVKLDYYDKAKIKIGPNRVPIMPPGDKIHMDSVARMIQDPTYFRNVFMREFASAIGIGFEQLSLNYSEANYSNMRAALLEVWRGVVVERRLFCQHVATPIFAAVVEEALEIGELVLPPGAPPFQENRAAYTRCIWMGPGMGWVDPLKEAQAQEIRLRAKTTTRQEEYAAQGKDYLEAFDQIEQENTEAEERNFTLDAPLPGQALSNDPGADPNAQSDPPKPPKSNANAGA